MADTIISSSGLQRAENFLVSRANHHSNNQVIARTILNKKIIEMLISSKQELNPLNQSSDLVNQEFTVLTNQLDRIEWQITYNDSKMKMCKKYILLNTIAFVVSASICFFTEKSDQLLGESLKKLFILGSIIGVVDNVRELKELTKSRNEMFDQNLALLNTREANLTNRNVLLDSKNKILDRIDSLNNKSKIIQDEIGDLVGSMFYNKHYYHNTVTTSVID